MKCPDTLVLCGHGDYGQDANNRIRKAAELARAAGEFPDYLIYGNSTYAKHRRKHNFLIGDVPAFAYTFCNVAHSKTRRAVFIGNSDSRQIFDACRTFFADVLRDFAREMMPRLRRSLELFTDFPSFMNAEFREFGLLEPYANGHFRSTLVGEQTLVDDLNFHRRFAARLRT